MQYAVHHSFSAASVGVAHGRCCSAGGIGVPAVQCVRHAPVGSMPDAVPNPTLVGVLHMCVAKTFVLAVVAPEGDVESAFCCIVVGDTIISSH